MPEREKVIRALEMCGYKEGMIQCDECPYDGKQCWTRLKQDAIALLKEQEPRVMTPDEVTNAPEKSVIWLELKPDDRSRNEIYPFVGSGKGWYSCYCSANTSPMFTDEDAEQYGVQFRCWTCQPTDEQRKAVKWNDQGGGHQNSGPV